MHNSLLCHDKCKYVLYKYTNFQLTALHEILRDFLFHTNEQTSEFTKAAI